ncbi:MAG: antA/AntB antirepressor family protein, partial [Nitrospirae bacterium]|nr:antA/AntB antirepressor family protein [Nitrospirota bacterium]
MHESTTQLIPVLQSTIGGREVQTVDARELHRFLEVRKKFSDWVKNRIIEYNFIENTDFITLSQNRESGGRTIEYNLTIDMAKELSMVERNAKGREARQYFIECERRYKAAEAHTLPPTDDPILMQAQVSIQLRIKQIELEERQSDLERRIVNMERQHREEQPPASMEGACPYVHPGASTQGAALSKTARGNLVTAHSNQVTTREDMRYKWIKETWPEFIEYADQLPRNQNLKMSDTYRYFVSEYLKGVLPPLSLFWESVIKSVFS